ncbi:MULTISPECIES: heavy-metal-associated domain-containing protein [Clostridium]|uniref:Copper chaperone CopZ n=2 Tax=Clostridium TaxID=1485 RepID=A0A151AQ27_9CLOT|nr:MULTISPECIES: cation transporter [Clostridium]KYH29693.1 copper chaperone CopZ [Clostridium colicanis DSM 13634]MBE6043991.1 heavy-metal-associated domain-containing protein [Clostridium thermopalmarium]PRR71816.1 Copper chaperone CopZ [Clostridium thermopalmarium DSM 5974]PVZ21363.1 Cu2+-exporting ATPase [Clostridium thermopalmarium DSM 5974]
MKAIIKVSNLRSQSDVGTIRTALSNEEGIIACHIKKEKGEVDIVYDSYFITLEKIQDLLDDMGYNVI